MKSYNKPEDVVRVCKGIADQGSTSLSEAELTGVITAYGKSIYPDMRPDAAFAKVFAADNELAGTSTKVGDRLSAPSLQCR
jgi:hypothetical protein